MQMVMKKRGPGSSPGRGEYQHFLTPVPGLTRDPAFFIYKNNTANTALITTTSPTENPSIASTGRVMRPCSTQS